MGTGGFQLLAGGLQGVGVGCRGRAACRWVAGGGAACRGWGCLQGVGLLAGGGAACRGWGCLQGVGLLAGGLLAGGGAACRDRAACRWVSGGGGLLAGGLQGVAGGLQGVAGGVAGGLQGMGCSGWSCLQVGCRDGLQGVGLIAGGLQGMGCRG